MMDEKEQNERELDLFVLLEDFLKIGKRFWALLVIMVTVCAVGATAYCRMNYFTMYEAYASFTVRVANPLYASSSGYNSKTAEVMAATFPSVINSNVLRKQVMEDMQINYLPSISVSATGGASIITIHVRDGSPEFAYAVLNSVIEHYPDILKFVLGPTEMELLDESGVPTQPIATFNPVRYLTKGGLIGAFLWCMIIACMALLKNTIHNEEELKRIVNLPCIGQIPNIKISNRHSCPLISREKSNAGFVESVRLLRVRVEKAMEETGKKVLLVSSAIPGEGKTTVSVNLATSLAQKGKRVLLIDCDLRNPSVTKALQLSSKNSMPEYMQGKVTIKDMIQNTPQENLFVISGGAGSGNGMIMELQRERTMRLILVAKKFYDYVILDTPPCSLLADAAEIANLAECGLMVIRQDYAAKEQIMDGIQRLSDSDLQLVGCAFNGVRKSLSNGYGYGYGYGYGSKKK